MHTYGGVYRQKWWRPLIFSPIIPGDKATPCDTMNGNCVLIPDCIAEKVGNLDISFTHRMGDFDYGLRARKLGIKNLVAPGYLGTCSRDSLAFKFWDVPYSLKDRWKTINSPLGIPPKERAVFARRHAGFFWIIFWISPYLRMLMNK
jgi:GT2 family glycosyltransferase